MHAPTIISGFRTIKKNPKQAYKNIANKKYGSWQSLKRGTKIAVKKFKSSKFYKSPNLVAAQFITHTAPKVTTTAATSIVTYPLKKHRDRKSVV